MYKTSEIVPNAKISQSRDVANYIRQVYPVEITIREAMVVLFLSNSNKTLGWSIASIGGLTATMVDGPIMAVLQTAVAPEVQGRVFTVTGSLIAVTSPLGLVVAGPLTDLVGLTTWYLIAGVACILLGALLFFVPDVVYIEERAKARSSDTLESHPV